MSPPEPKTGVLFVCLGNICRSPLAEGIFLHLARLHGVHDRFDIESCGTGGWHAGEPADPRSIAVAAQRGITLDHSARQFNPRADFARFGCILAMDRSNLRDIQAAAETSGLDASGARLMLSYAPRAAELTSLDVPDPYYGGSDGFHRVFDMLHESCEVLLKHLLR